MELIVRAGDREEKVAVRRTDHGYEVSLAGKTHEVDAVADRNGLWSLRFEGEHHEVAVRAQGNGSWRVAAREAAWTVEVADPLTHLARAVQAASGGRRRQVVTAYMPGRVVALLAKEGEEVKAGQGILVLEAMKMQNEIQAEHDGTVTRILVENGQSVDGGTPLFELE